MLSSTQRMFQVANSYSVCSVKSLKHGSFGLFDKNPLHAVEDMTDLLCFLLSHTKKCLRIRQSSLDQRPTKAAELVKHGNSLSWHSNLWLEAHTLATSKHNAKNCLATYPIDNIQVYSLKYCL